MEFSVLVIIPLALHEISVFGKIWCGMMGKHPICFCLVSSQYSPLDHKKGKVMGRGGRMGEEQARKRKREGCGEKANKTKDKDSQHLFMLSYTEMSALMGSSVEKFSGNSTVATRWKM